MSEKPPPSNNEPTQDRRPGQLVTEHVKSRTIWLRLFFMLVMGALYSVSRLVVSAVIVLQFFWVFFTGKPNGRLVNLGQALATYTYQIVRYLTFTTEERPFPFDADWPAGPPQS